MIFSVRPRSLATWSRSGSVRKAWAQMYDEEDNEPFLGRSMSRPAHGQSDDTARLIDEEVKDILIPVIRRPKQRSKRTWINYMSWPIV